MVFLNGEPRFANMIKNRRTIIQRGPLRQMVSEFLVDLSTNARRPSIIASALGTALIPALTTLLQNISERRRAR